MSAKELKGVLPVIQTPFRQDGSINREILHREIDWLFAEGVDGIVIAMVSEVLRLTDLERDTLTRHCVEIVAGRGPVVASVGAESSAQAIRHAKAAADAGADALMAIPPSLTRCPVNELVYYYKAILDATPLPLVVQDASGYVGNSIPVPTQAALLELAPDRVLFKPEAQPIGPNVSALLEATGGRARIFEGTAGLALMDSYPRGIVGTMPGADVPWAIVAIWRAMAAGDERRAGNIHARLLVEAGAKGVKLEGGEEILPAIQAILREGIPVLGHIGMLPQRVKEEGGYRIKGKSPQQADQLTADAKALDEAGVFGMVLELVSPPLAQTISQSVHSPTIGIGSGRGCDGQILVTYDLLGMFPWFTPRFVQPKVDLASQIQSAVSEFITESRSST